jgi:hypothetical protein
MGYTGESFEDLFADEYVETASRRIVDRVGTRIRDRAAMKTPVARLPRAYRGDFEEWIQDRGGRTPRTLRDSWEKSDVDRLPGGRVRVEIFNPDPVAIFVEENTRPHVIRAKMRIDVETGRIRRGALRFPQGNTFIYRQEVHHPGTQGVHMLRDALAWAEASWPEEGRRVLSELARVYSAR